MKDNIGKTACLYHHTLEIVYPVLVVGCYNGRYVVDDDGDLEYRNLEDVFFGDDWKEYYRAKMLEKANYYKEKADFK